VIVIDANILLYAYDSSSAHHEVARGWLETILSRPEPVGLAGMTVLAFLWFGTVTCQNSERVQI
jgi:hypothetical protein